MKPNSLWREASARSIVRAMIPDHAQSEPLEDKVFLFLVIGVTMAFFWILRPYAGAILWGTVLAIVFAPLNRHLRDRTRQRRGWRRARRCSSSWCWCSSPSR